MIAESMLTEVQRNCGMGDPPTPFYTNAPKSANAIIKKAVNFQQNDMSTFAMKMEQLIK